MFDILDVLTEPRLPDALRHRTIPSLLPEPQRQRGAGDAQEVAARPRLCLKAEV